MLGLMVAFAAVACGNPPVGEPPISGELEEDETTPSAVTLDGRGTFYAVRTDGEGTHVRRLNYKQTRCAEGDERTECRVAVLHVPAEAPAPAPESIYRGTLAVEGGQAVFNATEVWSPDVSLAAVPAGTFYRVENLDLLCARAPCPTLKQAKLNSSSPAKYLQTLSIADDLGTAVEREAAVNEARSSALIVVGANVPTKQGLVLEATQYYRRVDAPASASLTDP